MALIEDANVYTCLMAISAWHGQFIVIGEPIVAVDLINTVAAPWPSTGEDLLLAEPDAEAWWRIERGGVPGEDLPEDQEIIFTCAAGQRSASASEIAMVAGYNKVYNLANGMNGWVGRRYPIER